jgi:hypothetical protein
MARSPVNGLFRSVQRKEEDTESDGPNESETAMSLAEMAQVAGIIGTGVAVISLAVSITMLVITVIDRKTK